MKPRVSCNKALSCFSRKLLKIRKIRLATFVKHLKTWQFESVFIEESWCY